MTFSSYFSMNDVGSGAAFVFSSCESDSLLLFFLPSSCYLSRISFILASLSSCSLCAYSSRFVLSASSCSFLSLWSFFFSSAFVSFFTFCFFSFCSTFSVACLSSYCLCSSRIACSSSCCSCWRLSFSRFWLSRSIASC